MRWNVAEQARTALTVGVELRADAVVVDQAVGVAQADRLEDSPSSPVQGIG